MQFLLRPRGCCGVAAAARAGWARGQSAGRELQTPHVKLIKKQNRACLFLSKHEMTSGKIQPQERREEFGESSSRTRGVPRRAVGRRGSQNHLRELNSLTGQNQRARQDIQNKINSSSDNFYESSTIRNINTGGEFPLLLSLAPFFPFVLKKIPTNDSKIQFYQGCNTDWNAQPGHNQAHEGLSSRKLQRLDENSNILK